MSSGPLTESQARQEAIGGSYFASLADKYHVRHRFLRRLFHWAPRLHWVPRRETVYYELRAYRPGREPRRSAAALGIGQMTADASQQERVSAIEPVAHGRAHVVIRIRDHDGFLLQVR